jgi:hypothetical protein
MLDGYEEKHIWAPMPFLLRAAQLTRLRRRKSRPLHRNQSGSFLGGPPADRTKNITLWSCEEQRDEAI